LINWSLGAGYLVLVIIDSSSADETSAELEY